MRFSVANWTFLFLLLICLIFFERALWHAEQEYKRLNEKKESLLQKIAAAKKERETLHLMIQSQNDPAWIELVLRQHLGVIPDGFKPLP